MRAVLFSGFLFIFFACAMPMQAAAETPAIIDGEQTRPFIGQWEGRDGPVCNPCALYVNSIDAHSGMVSGTFATAVDGAQGTIGVVGFKDGRILLTIITLSGKSLEFELPQDGRLQGRITVNKKFNEPSGDGKILTFFRVRR